MIPHGQLFGESIRFSRTVVSEMDIVYNGVVLENDVPLVGGKVDTDRSSNTRYSGSVDMGLYPWDDLPLDAYGTRVRLRHGVSSIGTKEVVPVGEYQIYDYKRTNRGSLALTLKGLEQFVIESEFIRPRTPPYGSSTVATIIDLITEVLPSAEVVMLASNDRRITATGAWDTDRWGAITQLADSIDAEVFCGYDGRFYVMDGPDLGNLAPLYRLDGGDTGVLVEETRSRTRDQVYNAVSVSAQSSDQNVPPAWAWAYDNNPDSPTYFYGPFGQRVRFYSSQFFTTADQCLAYAQRLLIESLAPNESLSVGSSPIPFLEAGDPVEVVSQQDQPTGVYLLQKTSLALGTGNWTAEVLSSKDVAVEAQEVA